MELLQYYHVNNQCYKAGKPLTPKGFMLHSTGANNPNLRRYVASDNVLGINANNNTWNTELPDGRQVCVHGFIGRKANGSIATCQTLPWNMRGWHCGSGKNGSGNDTLIGVEICEDSTDDKAYLQVCFNEAADLAAMLAKQFGFTANDVICHSEGYAKGIASNHADVMHWFSKHGFTMNDFRAAVNNRINGVTITTPPAATTVLYRVRSKWNDATTQTGAYTVLQNAINDCDKQNKMPQFKVFDEQGNIVYPK